jgi:hypothetical protein
MAVKATYAPGERNERLGSLSNAELRQVLTHERHKQNLGVVRALVARLHKLRMPADYYEFHRELVAGIYSADKWRAQCSEIERLLRGGAESDPSWQAVDWRLERIVADRMCRQLRSVGDGLAWKVLAYERHLIVALGHNRSDPSLFGKVGFGCELRVLQDTWEKNGHFAILHDATNCLTVGDLTICSEMHAPWVNATSHTCNPERWVIAEVKSIRGICKTRFSGRQLKRAQMAINAVVNNTPLVGEDGVPRTFFRSTKQYKTHLRQVATTLEDAWRTGHAVGQLRSHWVVSARAPVQAWDSGTPWSTYAAKDDKALLKAGLNTVRDRFLLTSADALRLAPGRAPFSIYPFRPAICAALICDYLAFVSMLGINALTDALLTAGFTGVQEIRPIDLSQHDRAVVRGFIKTKGMSINNGALAQIVFEAVDLKREAEAMLEYSLRPDATPAIGVLTLKNERATWR